MLFDGVWLNRRHQTTLAAAAGAILRDAEFDSDQ
jgi:hypothetical protein